MTMSRDTALEEWARRALAGETLPDAEMEALGPVYGWRLLRWEADIPLTDEQGEQLQGYARASMRMLGVCAARCPVSRRQGGRFFEIIPLAAAALLFFPCALDNADNYVVFILWAAFWTAIALRPLVRKEEVVHDTP